MEELELERFVKFASSSYFNTNKNLVSLLHFILRFASDYESEQLDEQNAFLNIFEGKAYNGNKRAITKLSSRLFKLANQFIAVERLRSNDFEIKYNLLLHYRDKVLPEEFDKLSKNISQDIHLELICPSDFFQKFRLEREINRRISRMQDRGSGDVYFDNAIEALDSFYIYQKLIYTCQKLNRNKIIPDASSPSRLLSVLDDLAETSYANIPQIKIWLVAYLMLSADTSEKTMKKYLQLKDLLMNNRVKIDDEQKKALFTFLANQTFWLFPREKVFEKLYEIYHYEYRIGILLQDKTASPLILKNYVTILVFLKKFDEAQTFLEEKKDDFVPVFNEYYQTGCAILEIGRGHYEKALDILNGITLKNINLKVNDKKLRLKIYHQLGYHDLVVEHINAYRVFIANNGKTLQPKTTELNRNFISMYMKITKNGSTPKELIDEIEQHQSLLEKKWLKSLIVNKL